VTTSSLHLLGAYRAATPVKRPFGTLGVIDVVSGLSVLTVPIVLWVTARLLAPQYFTVPSRRLKGVVAAAAAATRDDLYIPNRSGRTLHPGHLRPSHGIRRCAPGQAASDQASDTQLRYWHSIPAL
jgi:hypothetical protein